MCHPCTEDCYLNWEITITRETNKVDELNGNVTELLESFGSMSVDSINKTLQMLKTNVSYAEEIFSSGGRENLQKKQQQINRVNEKKLFVIGCFNFSSGLRVTVRKFGRMVRYSQTPNDLWDSFGILSKLHGFCGWFSLQVLFVNKLPKTINSCFLGCTNNF